MHVALTYLGINLSPSYPSLYEVNYPSCFRHLERLLSIWAMCDLSWLGRIHAIKMTLLPKLLYLFQSLLVKVSRLDLFRFQAKVITFIWGTKGHRLARSTLFAPRSGGGLGVPNFYAYYKAAQIMQLSTVYSRHERPDWVSMERQAIPSFTIDFLFWRPPKERPLIQSPTLSHSFAMWDQVRSGPLLSSTFTPLAHMFRNPDFPPGMDIKAFRWWTDKSLYCIGHFFTHRGPLTLSHCSSVLEMPPTERFSFYQIANFLRSIWPSGKPPTLTAYEQWCTKHQGSRGGISMLYESLLSPPQK